MTAAERQRREAIRLAAAEDFEAGATNTQVARPYRVTRMSAWRWHHALETAGRDALRSKGTASRCRLADEDLALLEQLLDLGPAAQAGEAHPHLKCPRYGGKLTRFFRNVARRKFT